MSKEIVIHFFRDKDNATMACQIEGAKNIVSGFALSDTQFTPLHMLNIAMSQCLAELALRFLERRHLKPCCLITLSVSVNGTSQVRIERADVVLKLPLRLSEEDETVLIRVLHQCPIHAVISRSITTRIVVREDRESISYYEKNILTDMQHTAGSISPVPISDYALWHR